MAVGDLVRLDANGVTVTGVQLTNNARGSIARVFNDGGVAPFRPQGEPVRVIAAAGSPRAVAAARLVTDANAPFSGNVEAAARANGLPARTENSAENWVRDRSLVFGSTTVTDADRARGTFERGTGSASSSNPDRLTAAERRSQAARARTAGPASNASTGNS